MVVFSFEEQVILQIIVCFSFLNTMLMVAFNKGKSFPKVLGLGFVIPLILGLFAILSPDILLRQTISLYLDLFYILFIFLLVICWRSKKNFVLLSLIAIYPILILFLVQKFKTIELPAILLSPYLYTAITLALTAAIIFLLRNSLEEKDTYLTAGLILLGIAQSWQMITWDSSLFVVIAAKLTSYLLFFLYILRNSRGLYLARLKKAEDKLADLSKAINSKAKKRIFDLERHNERLVNMVQKDPLVDAYNKKGILSLLKEMVEEPGAEGFTILLFDIDNFKYINDTKGHIAGDMHLKKVTQIARKNIRGFDYLGRFGGDEFIIIFPGTSISDVLFVAERFRKGICTETNISVSIGVAAYPEDGRKVEEMIEVADAGLYEAKRRGKNAVVHYR